MARILTDNEIAELLAEPKPVTDKEWGQFVPAPPSGRGKRLRIAGRAGHSFEAWSRSNPKRKGDFSVGLELVEEGKNTLLTRFDGDGTGAHVNHLEPGSPVYSFRACCHIHITTERYQLDPRYRKKPEHYAEPTTLFHDLQTAMIAFAKYCHLSGSDALRQKRMFSEGTDDRA